MIKILIFIFSFPIFGGVYNYSPESTMSLGKGFNPFQPTHQYQDCFDFQAIEELDTEGAISTDIVINLVKSYKDLYRYLRFSASAAASYKIFSGSSSLDFEEESMFHSDSLTWLVLFRSDFGRNGLKSPYLKKEFENLSPDLLYQKCGAELVTSVKRGSMVYALLTIKNLKQDDKSRLEKKFKAKARGSLWSVKMRGYYKKIINSALLSNEVSVKIHAVGGEGLRKFKNLIGNGYIDYEKIPEVLSSYLEHLNKKNSAPLQYTTTPLSAFTEEPIELEVFRGLPLSEIYFRYQEAQSKANRLYKILYGSNQNKYEIDNKQSLINNYKDLISIQNKLWKKSQECLTPKKQCKIPEMILPLVQWPYQLKNYCENKRLEALEKGILNIEYYIMAKKRNLIPIVEHQKIVGYKSCN